MEKLFIYTRVSTTKQSEEGYSLQAQKNLGVKKAKSLKMDYQVFEEAGASAAKEDLDNRPVMRKLLDLCDRGTVKNVFVVELDRLSRNPATEIYIRKVFQDNDVILHTLNQKFDFKSYEDEFLSALQTLLARRENRKRSEGSKRGMLEAVKQGKWHGGILPYGYTKDELGSLIPDEEERVTYNRIVELHFSGMGCNKIADVLNRKGVKTKAQKMYKKGTHVVDKFSRERKFKSKDKLIWKGGTIHGILTNPLYKGERSFLDEKIKGTPPLISHEKWGMIQKNLKQNFNNSPRNTKRFYLLRGMLYCKRCDCKLFGLIKPSRNMRAYCCMSKRPDPSPRFCGLKNINLDKIENLVWSTVLRICSSENIKNELAKHFEVKADKKDDLLKQIESLKRKVKEKNKEKERVMRLYGSGEFSEDEIEKIASTINEEKQAIISNLELLTIKVTNLHDNQAFINSLSTAMEELKRIDTKNDAKGKRRILEMFIDKIIVDYHDFENLGIDIIEENGNVVQPTNEHTIEIKLKIPLFEKVFDLAYGIPQNEKRKPPITSVRGR